MSEPRWTPAQQDAIDARGGTLLVSAAAGSGKTAVLTERAVRRMLDDASPIAADRLLIVTFTRAAAREMRARLVQKLSRRVADEPQNPLPRRQRRLLESAVIGTIHSLCFDLLRQNFQRLGLPASFRVGESQEISALREEAVGQALEERYRTGDPAFLALSELLSSGRGDAALADTVLRLLDFARAHPFYLDWMEERLALYEPGIRPAESVWGRIILDEGRSVTGCALAECRAALDQIRADETLESYRAAFEGDLALLEQLAELMDADAWDQTVYTLAGFTHVALRAARKADRARTAALKQARQRVKDAVERLRDRCFLADEAAFADDLADLAPTLEQLFALARQTDELLTTAKLTQGIIDFSDLEQLCLELLVERDAGTGGYRRTALAVECAGCFDEIMVDEYQDVNEAQDLLLWALSTEDNLFLVGDVKQSIYRFRQARPELFLDKADSYRVYDGTAFPAQVRLNGNFRSRAEVTACVNQTFAALMSREAGEIDYDDAQALLPMASYPAGTQGSAALHLLDAASAEGEGGAAALEAAYVAALVERLLREGRVAEGETTRPLRPGDVCVLLRSPRSRGRLYATALRERGVSGAVELQEGLLETTEVAALLALLRAVDNPTRDVELAGALLSPLVGLTEDELARARVETPRGGLYAALTAAAAHDQRCRQALSLLEELRGQAAVLTASQLICLVFERTGFDLVARAMPNGAQRQANLLRMLRAADEWQERGRRSLAAFLDLLDRMVERGEDLAPATPPEGNDAVTICSIHRSKGLEWPVVILADMGRSHSFYQNDLIAPTMLHAELGFACVRRDPALKKQFVTLPLAAMRLASERALLSEELRVLYVAMTRAREQLYLTGCVRHPADKLEGLPPPAADGRVPPPQVLEGKGFAEWLLLALSQRPDLERLRLGLPGADGFSLLLADAPPAAGETALSAAEAPAAPDEALLAALRTRCAFVYPHADDCRRPAKLAVSQLSHGGAAGQPFSARPAFLREGGLTGAERGQAVHSFMQLCDYDRARRDPGAELARLREGGWLTPKQAEAVDLSAIGTFFASDLAGRIFGSARVLREFGFLAPAAVSPRAQALLGEQSGETMLQGIADCVFFEGERAVLLDYKTDRVKEAAPLLERYADQLLVYRDLLGAALGITVGECWLWSFALGRAVEVRG